MLLLFNKSESLECAKVVVLKLGAILFYNGIHNYEKRLGRAPTLVLKQRPGGTRKRPSRLIKIKIK